MASVQDRTNKGIPTELTRISTIHFGRMMIVRPEMYLTKSGVDYTDPDFMPVPLDEIEYRLSHIPDARHVVVPDAGHYVHLENPDFVLDAVGDFLAEVGW